MDAAPFHGAAFLGPSARLRGRGHGLAPGNGGVTEGDAPAAASGALLHLQPKHFGV